MYTSTRKKLNYKGIECIVKGISDDGGLFIRSDFYNYKLSEKLIDFNYNELAFDILKFYFPEFTDNEINEIINKSYNNINFKEKIVDVKDFKDVSFLELFHGPTLAFKDMALTILPNLMSYSKKKLNHKKKTLILTATSGDTGGACLSGFMNNEDCNIVVLYPTDGVSDFQEKQMHFYTNHKAYAIAVEGNFDDCQNLVKKVFTSKPSLKNMELSSANSINIGRLVPQIVYYFYTYFEEVRRNNLKYGDKINFVVPTGNFGNILACYIAKKMGLFIDKIVCASNENNVLTDFFNTLNYNKNREFHVTNSPAMDILISSNLERLLYLIIDEDEEEVKKLMKDLNETGSYSINSKYKDKFNDFYCYSVNKENTLKYIEDCYRDFGYLIDPHTAVAYGSYLNLKEKLNGKTVVVSTASPFKFIESVNDVFKIDKAGIELVNKLSFDTNNKVPSVLYDIYSKDIDKVIWTKENMEDNLIKLIGDIDESC